MSRAGKNTPASVLAFIDAHLDRVPDPRALAVELGYDSVAIHKLEQKHGNGLLRYLQGVRRARSDPDRFLAKQQGRAHPEQYAASYLGAVDDLPCIPQHYEARVNDIAIRNAENLYAEMCRARDAVKKLLDEAANPLYAGELRRSHSQMVKACEKARKRLDTRQLDRAA